MMPIDVPAAPQRRRPCSAVLGKLATPTPRALRCAMASAVEIAVETYIRMWSEPDPAVRATMLAACFAADGRMVTRSREIRGRTAFADLMTNILADPQLLRIRVISAIDAKGTTFRFRSVVERRDGTTPESFDAGQIDADGRISLLLTFAGPLAESGQLDAGARV
jgi:hypothetical protein